VCGKALCVGEGGMLAGLVWREAVEGEVVYLIGLHALPLATHAWLHLHAACPSLLATIHRTPGGGAGSSSGSTGSRCLVVAQGAGKRQTNNKANNNKQKVGDPVARDLN
jgi:hypothetical protein